MDKIEVSEEFFVENNIIKTTLNRDIEHGLGYELFRSMKIFKENIAQFIVDGDEEDTYESLLTRSIRCALKMRDHDGLEKDDIIAICSHNHKNTCIPLIASIFIGVKVSTLDSVLSINDAIYLLKQVTPKMIFCSSDGEKFLRDAIRMAKLEGIKLIVFEKDFFEYLKSNAKEKTFTPDDVDDVNETAMIYFSSGTTGLAKGICISHRSFILSAFTFIDNAIITSVTLSFTKLYWISSVCFIFGSILSGTARVIAKDFHNVQVWYLLDKYKVSLLFMAPSMAIDMAKAGRPEGLDTTNLLTMVIGGSVMSTQYLLLLRDLLPGTFVCQGYGQTENGGMTTCFKMNSPRDAILLDKKPDSCGRPVNGIWYKVLDIDTRKPLGPNQKGELLIKSQSQFNGYYKRDSSEAFDSDGWLLTGDLVYYDDDYCFYIIERLKQLIKYRGHHVPPVLIENLLQGHPAVAMSAVLGIPHEEDGEHPMAFIVLKKGYKDVDPIMILKFIEERVHDNQKLRGGIKFVDKLPLTPSGKIKRLELKNMILNGNTQ